MSADLTLLLYGRIALAEVQLWRGDKEPLERVPSNLIAEISSAGYEKKLVGAYEMTSGRLTGYGCARQVSAPAALLQARLVLGAGEMETVANGHFYNQPKSAQIYS